MSLPAWGDVPTWAGVGVAACALVGAALAYRKQALSVTRQSEQLDLQREQFRDQQQANVLQAKVLQLQAEHLTASIERLEREAQERRIAQASKVVMSLTHQVGGDRTAFACVKNGSDAPLSAVQFRWSDSSDRQAVVYGELATLLMPGAELREARDDSLMVSADVVFRDAAGVMWALTPLGFLKELSPEG